ncbi:hypothetical protein B0T19DRAFT_404902 [Cercophora scortea]|uniref:Uncharacterized protein n=1 Tax=Cercophora scortea TaxID=314031 RepID=A0AAE0M2Z9_9PEZI|nr:hypothetical protein B0T19DRAFT_404902 [Cercophora scortea]
MEEGQQGANMNEGRSSSPFTTAVPSSPPTKARNSTWGPHWQCEEIAQKAPGYQQHQLDSGANCDSDNHAIAFRMQETRGLHSASLSSPYGLLSAIGPSLMKLDITLRVPLLFLQAIFDDNITESTYTGSPNTRTNNGPEAAAQHIGNECHWVRKWAGLWPALAFRLRKLRHLHVWLDHEDSRSWSLVNECAVLSSLARSFPLDNIAGLEGVSLTLPNLHPLHENPEIHFIASSLKIPPSIAINRRMRPVYWFEVSAPGERAEVMHVADFPFMVQYSGIKDHGWEDTSQEEIQEIEREWWLTGELGNPYRRLELIGPPALCRVCISP